MQALVLASQSPTPKLDETRRALVDAARNRFGALPGDAIVEHVLSMAGDGDFAVHEAALEALRRRWSFAQRDGLVVATRPGAKVFGAYTTTRSGARRQRGRGRSAPVARPYRSVLESLSPLRASCDCPDFLRSSLGLCKHLLTVLHEVFASRQRLTAASRETPFASTLAAQLSWCPRLPLTGALDRLAGLRLQVSAAGQRRAASRDAALAELEQAFPGGELDPRARQQLGRRRDLLARLHELLSRGRRQAVLDASPAARALVAEELERVERRLRHEGEVSALLRHLRSMRRGLYPYQREGVQRFLSAGRLLLADDMGLGKTTQAVAVCHALFHAGRVKRGVVIAPASLKPQWLREWQETTEVPAALVDGTPEQRARQYRALRRGFLIIGYEQLLRDALHVQRLSPEIVVLDEAQRIKNYATKSAAYVKALAPEYRLVLTGTPMENRLEELASILDWVDDVALSPKWRLVPWHTEWEGDAGRVGKAGARNLDALRTRLRPCLVRRVRQEVLDQLPARTDTRVPVEMTPQQLEEHDALLQPIASLLHVSKRRPLTQAEFLKLMSLLTTQRIISNGLGQLRFDEVWPAYRNARPDAALLQGLLSPKLSELRRLITDLVRDQGRKVVVFSQWRRMLRLAEWSLRDLLGEAGLRAVFFTGAERPAQRTRSIVDFHDDPRVRVMFLSDAGGVGLNLQRAASACINLELPWNPAVLEQRIGRIHRLGQKQPIDVFNLVSEGGIESRISALVGAKQALFSALFDGTNDTIRFDAAASFLTRVERLVDPGALPTAPRASGASAPGEVDDADEEAPGEEVQQVDGAAEPTALAQEAGASVGAPTLEATANNGAAANGHNGAHPANGAVTAAAAIANAPDPAALLSRLRVERTPEGSVRIEAPPEAAGSLVALFEGMARLLAGAVSPP